MSDCNTFTQAGYIGDDAEQCVHRLLAAANYDVAQAEHGIICLDEIDKIATAKVSQGRDVSGEGVQQALLKIIEGTTIQITAKQEKGAGRQMSPGGYPGGGGLGNMSSGSGSKTEQYNVRTDNILFILTGAFIGLSKIVRDRVSTGGMGFGQAVRLTSKSDVEKSLAGEQHIYRKQLPFFAPNAVSAFNILDLVESDDLKKYGLIPELVGRIGITTAVGPLDEEALIRVLTEPQNALLRQFIQRFRYSDIELQFTSAALREIARAALEMGTGARGLRAVLMRLLADAMYETPG
jgi:ATP-dependent Clp protease ATP-binding subunit ClpX